MVRTLNRLANTKLALIIAVILQINGVNFLACNVGDGGEGLSHLYSKAGTLAPSLTSYLWRSPCCNILNNGNLCSDKSIFAGAGGLSAWPGHFLDDGACLILVPKLNSMCHWLALGNQ